MCDWPKCPQYYGGCTTGCNEARRKPKNRHVEKDLEQRVADLEKIVATLTNGDV